MTPIITAALISPVKPDINASTERKIIRGFITARPNSLKRLWRLSWATTFCPCSFNLFLASFWVRPSLEVSKFWKTASASLTLISRSCGETWMSGRMLGGSELFRDYRHQREYHGFLPGLEVWGSQGEVRRGLTGGQAGSRWFTSSSSSPF